MVLADMTPKLVDPPCLFCEKCYVKQRGMAKEYSCVARPMACFIYAHPSCYETYFQTHQACPKCKKNPPPPLVNPWFYAKLGSVAVTGLILIAVFLI